MKLNGIDVKGRTQTSRSLCLRAAVAASLTTFLMLGPFRAGQAAEVDDILVRMRKASEPGQDMKANFELAIGNTGGEKVSWSGRYYRAGSGEGARVHIAFEHPLELRGTEITIRRRPDGLSATRIFLPSLRRVRTIEGDMRGESFLGTDFNYEDLALQDLTFQRQTLLTGDGKDPDCIWVESIPERGWWCGKMLRCISKQTYLPRRTEYYSRDGTLWKVRTFDSVKEIGGFPTATEIATKTVPLGTSTRIILTDVQYDTKIPESVFERP
jgi:hypothetical protein